MTAVYSTLFALLLATVLVPLVVRIAPGLGLLDRPGGRKIHREPIPRAGGIAIAAAALASVAVWLPFTPEVVAYALGALLIFVAGLVDDRLDLDYRLKFGAQFVAALLFMLLGDVWLTRLPFMAEALPAGIGMPLTVLFLVAITNAVNLSDGMDGLAGGTSLLAASVLGYIAYAGGDRTVVLLALCLVGAVLGFLRYNTFPARVFMGDSGSQFLGFSVGVLALLVVERCDRQVSPLLPLLVLALPILDTLQVMVRRLATGRSPFSPDRQHIHHRLLALGLDQRGAVILIYLVQGGLVLLAWSLRHASDLVVGGVLLLLGGALLGGLGWLERHREAGKPWLPARWMAFTVGYLRENAVLARLGRTGLAVMLSVLFVVAAFASVSLGTNVGWLALVLSLLLLVDLAGHGWYGAGRLAVYTLSALSVYLVESGHLETVFPTAWFHAYLGLMLILVAIRLRFGGGRDFQLNPFDLLIVLAVMVVPNLPVVQEMGIGPMLVESLLLFYAVELVMNDESRRPELLRASALGSLAVLTVRGLVLAA